jgi:hypothetical protein
VIGYMKDFLFPPGEQARTPVGVLSGDERATATTEAA